MEEYLNLSKICIEAKECMDILDNEYDFISYEEISEALFIGYRQRDTNDKYRFTGMKFRQRSLPGQRLPFHPFKKIVIRNCHFIDTYDSSGLVDIYLCDQKRMELVFDNCIFDIGFRISSSKFKKVDIDHCIFNEHIYLNTLDSSTKVCIHRSTINNGLFSDENTKIIEIRESSIN